MKFELRRLPGSFAVVRLDRSAGIPSWMSWEGALVSVTAAGDEMSVICPEDLVPAGARAERGFAAWRVEGPLAFDSVGVLSALCDALAREGISLLALSTYDTDYLLVRRTSAPSAEVAWRLAGHNVG